ncbi:group 1 truncated hemoglobin [Rhodoferax sp. AJA081-3]|uniref:group I truncated hemoglobin n=1 Tax=Rhodoferax sp. AJA081-3 TaxID=2752316 RepID=UPI001ADFA062|nr:group 1 truncated hemoglobin [Rhodoferax sp. AJA081-3]QTN26175.1 group 1 truncated hemoglobin [Rhodoferax sp. AJA081-3]
MKKRLTSLAPALLLAASTLLALPASAQTAPTPMAASSALFDTFGGKAGLAKLMDNFMVGLLADPRTGPHFKPANQQRIKEQLVDQFCVVMGGPCVYKGADMKSSHEAMDITKGDFNALVEVLQRSMDAQGIPFGAQNQLLAKLAPMHRDVITVK